jgi:hypothetical protein
VLVAPGPLRALRELALLAQLRHQFADAALRALCVNFTLWPSPKP